MLEFDSRSIHVRFVIDKVALIQVFLPEVMFSPVGIILPLFHTHLHLNTNKDKRAKPGSF
jgi:hypothetical protein